MGSPADYTIIFILLVLGYGIVTILDRLAALRRDVDALRGKDV